MAGVPNNALPVQPLDRVPARYGLLAAIEAMGNAVDPVVDEASGRVDEHWLNGITYLAGLGCGIGLGDSVMPLNCDSPYTGGDAGESETSMATTMPFLTRARFQCAAWGFPEVDFPARARTLFEACESTMVEFEFWTGNA